MADLIKMMERLEEELEDAQGQKRVEMALTAWKWRMMGLSFMAIANEMDCSEITVIRAIRYAKEHFPSIAEDMEDVQQMCLFHIAQALEWVSREEVDEDRYQKERIRLQAVDLLAKMFGLNKVQLEVSQVRYILDVNPEEDV